MFGIVFVNGISTPTYNSTYYTNKCFLSKGGMVGNWISCLLFGLSFVTDLQNVIHSLKSYLENRKEKETAG